MNKWLGEQKRLCEYIPLLLISLVHVFQMLRGVSNYCYIGHDFDVHQQKIEALFGSFSFRDTNPPLFYLLAACIRRVLPLGNYLANTALITGLLNLLAVLFIYRKIRVLITSVPLRLGLFAIIIFVPFRVLSATAISADSLTFCFFALLFSEVPQLLRREESVAFYTRQWVIVSIILSCALMAKYSAINYILGLALILWIQHKFVFAREQHLIGLLSGGIALTLPVLLFSLMMVQSYRQKSYTTHEHFRGLNSSQQMNWLDLTLPKLADVELLRAPTYGSLLGEHHFSYFGLLYVTAFSDYANLYQPVPKEVPLLERSPDFGDIRTPRSVVSGIANRVSVLFSLLLVFSAGWGSLRALLESFFKCQLSLSCERRRIIMSTVILSFSFFLPFFFALPFTQFPYANGYFLPRLTQSGLMGFLILGFVLWDKYTSVSKGWRNVLSFYSAMMTATYLLAL